MRLLIATQHLRIVGGVETYLHALLPLLAKRGFEIAVLAEFGESPDGILSAYPDLPIWTTSGGSVKEVFVELGRWKPEIVYCQGLLNSEVESSLADRFATVLYAHNYSGTCVSGTKCYSRPFAETCNRTLGPGCLAAYFPRGCGGRNPITMLRLYRNEQRRRRNLTRYGAVLVASNHMVEEFRRHGVASDRLILAPLFAPDTRSDANPPLPKARTDRILFVGRLTILKGWRELVAAIPLASAALGRTLTLVVAGDGPDQSAFESEARRRSVPVEFLGWVNSAERQTQMRAADLLAVPSVWPEPFGLVGIEAGCVGLPAVGFAVGGIPDWLIPGVTGESAPGDRPNPKELASALVRALADDGHRHRLSQGAWEMSRQFTPEAHLDRLIPILESAAR